MEVVEKVQNPGILMWRLHCLKNLCYILISVFSVFMDIEVSLFQDLGSKLTKKNIGFQTFLVCDALCSFKTVGSFAYGRSGDRILMLDFK